MNKIKSSRNENEKEKTFSFLIFFENFDPVLRSEQQAT
jgi:hypothetical protein